MITRVRTICNVCEGDGYLPDPDDEGEDIDVGSAIRCEECGGSGFAEDLISLKDDAP